MINDIENFDHKILNNVNEFPSNILKKIDVGLRNEANIEDNKLRSINNENLVHHFYDFPKYYDKAFTRDVKGDISFFIDCFQKYSDIEIKRVLEPACGPGMFLEILPQFGFYALGYDLNPAMVEYAKQKLNKSGVKSNVAEVIEGNMKNMKFDDKFDAAFIAINSLGYLRDEEDISAHFRIMGESINKGGLYIVELSCQCNDLNNEKKYDDTWYVKEDDLDIELTWAINWYDIKNRIRHVDFRMVVNENGNNLVISEAHELRLWIFDEFKRFTELGGFEIVGVYNQNYERIDDNTTITGELGALFFILKKI
ncbi:MAG: class I SAM-dependent methyltransferase [Promethearchaeota archaeon]